MGEVSREAVGLRTEGTQEVEFEGMVSVHQDPAAAGHQVAQVHRGGAAAEEAVGDRRTSLGPAVMLAEVQATENGGNCMRKNGHKMKRIISPVETMPLH